MPTSKHWSEPEDDSYVDDDGNVIYFDKTGKLRRFNTNDREFQQMYHYYEEDN
jgi:hypothetical protein